MDSNSSIDDTRAQYDQAIRVVGALCAQLAAEKNDERSDALLVDIRLALPSGHRAELAHLIKNGPVHDGDVMSKAHVGDLLRWGLAAKVMVKGAWGYTAATYRGGHVLSDRLEVTSYRGGHVLSDRLEVTS